MLNLLHYSNSKRFYSEPDVFKYGETLIAKVLFRTWCSWWAQQTLIAKVLFRTWCGSVQQTLKAKDSIQNLMRLSTKRIVSHNLGWKFWFLVPFSGTPIGSRVPIPFPIPDILVGFFFRILLLKRHQLGFRYLNSEFRFFYVGTQYISFCTTKQSQYLFPPKLHLLALLVKQVDVILAGKVIMPPNWHLLKTSRCDFCGQNNHASKLTSTQNK